MDHKKAGNIIARFFILYRFQFLAPVDDTPYLTFLRIGNI